MVSIGTLEIYLKSPSAGDIVFSKVLGHAVIIVNSEEAARELSDEKRSAIYSDRPSLSAYNL